MRQSRRLFGSLLVLVFLLGCSESQTAVPEEFPVVDGEWDGVTPLPLELYLEIREPQMAHFFDLALDQALMDCVTEAGQEFDIPTRTPPENVSLTNRRYGLMNIEEATTYGYRPPPQSDNSKALVAFQQTLSSEVESILNGPEGSGGGCLDQVGVTLALRDDPRWQDLATVEEMFNSTLYSSVEEPVLVEALQQWGDCVEKEVGLSFIHPSEAMAHFVSRETASEEEKIAAIADVNCKYQVGLIETWQAVETELQQVLIDENHELLERAHAFNSALIDLMDHY